MKKKAFFLSLNGEQIGPFSAEQVLKKLETKEQAWTDYVYSESRQDWIMLMEHPEFTRSFNAGHGRPAAQAIPAVPTFDLRPDHHLREKEWFLLKEGNNYGPFSKLDLVQMLQEKSLYEYDYVWHHGMNAWRRVAELPDFSPEKIRAMKESKDGDVSEVFFRRRHARARYGCSLLVHNSKTVFKGHSLEISEGGAGVVINNPVLQPGQTIYLHFQPGDGVPPFNAVCMIVSKQWIQETGENKPVKYGVKFTSISQPVRESIRDYAMKNGKAA